MTSVDLEPQPPSDVAAEAAVLGAVMLSPSALDVVADSLLVQEFYRPAHQTIYATILQLYAGGEPVDPITVCDRLSANGELARVGGAPYLHTLTHQLPTAANAGYYADIVTRTATQRRAVETGQRIQHLGHTWPVDDDGLTERIEQLVAELAGRAPTNANVTDLDTALDEAFARLAGPLPPTIPTGLHDLDEVLTGGLRKAAVYVVAARPGCGKSLVGANIALRVAQGGTGALICSLEMSRDEITNRTLANMAGVELTAITTHQLTDPDWARLRTAREQFRGVPLMIRDTPHLTSASLRRLAQRLTRTPPGLGLIVIDYAQQMTPADPRAPREQQVAEISRSAKRLAMHLHVPIVLLAQTNRKAAERVTADMSDLRESGSLEADADVVIILRLPDDIHRAGELDAHIVKNRHGRQAVIPLAWSPHYARIRSLHRTVS
ncbi:MAG: replicative DNA helicase [Pseudonocardiaceae bacterium]